MGNAKFVFYVILSLLIFGLTWAIGNQAVVVTALAITIVWALKYAATLQGVKLSKEAVTGALYVISFGLVIAINPGILPAWPVSGSVNDIVDWARQATILLLPYTGAAMTVYNLLLKNVLDQLPDLFSLFAR